MRHLFCFLCFTCTLFTLTAQSNIQWSKLKIADLHVNPLDSAQSLSGQQQYTLQVALDDTAQVNAFRINGQNASRQLTLNNAIYELKDQRIYRSTRNNDFVVYIDLGYHPTGNLKEGDIEILNRHGNAISATPNTFAAP